MQLILHQPVKALNKSYLKEKVSREHIELFKKNLKALLSRINEQESEEHLKNVVADFLKDTWYKEQFEINTKDRNDLVIHTGKSTKEPPGVILEVKKPSNKPEMMSEARPNAKALHELILYYLRERIDNGNIDIKYLIVTNIYEWVIMDEVWFEKNIFRNPKLKKDYENWKLSGKDTRFFYDSIAKPFLEEVKEELTATYFDVRQFEKIVNNSDRADDNKLIALYKILSPAHLLKQAFINDSNSLDTKFYSELLHIIGLEEVKDGGKKLIKRKLKPDEASLLENTIIKLEDKEALRNISNLSSFGATKSEQLFNVALELCITWINRILFIKLLEAQLYNFHKGDKGYLFLNSKVIFDFDELNNLFFQVLAEKPEYRRNHIKEKFSKVPYLNSSLFDRIELERQTINISDLDNRLQLPLISSTVLKYDKGKRQTGALPTLQYLFEFLDAYDFTSEGGEEIQEENKNLINASVLGLIFEKINGYKDGSFFTPGFITTYMCRETLRRAVVQQMNDAHGWNCKTFEDLQGVVEYQDKTKRQQANELINRLRICDPAVGSGHFLVSSLNELIAIKHDLKILQFRDSGQRIREYRVEVVNDELIVLDIETEELFEYKLNQKGNIKPELQAMQETLFHEKETLIENCLFGVDINPNSVKICRLRLWIELLKNAYYTGDSNYVKLETLPNIDINIKCGNSLISRFGLDADIKSTLGKGKSKWSIDSYKIAVQAYREADSKEQKREMEELIDSIKKDFQTRVGRESKQYKDLTKLELNYFKLYSGHLFNQNLSKLEIKKRADANALIEKKKKLIEEIKSNKIYENAFEWRFEFPEVLNDEGEFVGFDVVIGNPPYISIQDLKKLDYNAAVYYKNNFETTSFGNFDIYIPFVELANKITNKSSDISYILPSKFLTTDYGKGIREYLLKNKLVLELLDFGHSQVFDTATTYTCIMFLNKVEKDHLTFIKIEPVEIFSGNKVRGKLLYKDIQNQSWIFDDDTVSSLVNKIKERTTRLINIPSEISRGSSTGDDKIFILKRLGEIYTNGYDEIVDVENSFLINPIFATDYSRYVFKENDDFFLIFPYTQVDEKYFLIEESVIEKESPKLYQYLVSNSERLRKRKQYSKWYGYSAARNLNIHGKSDLLIPLLADRGLFTITPKEKVYTLMAGGGFSISLKNTLVDKFYLLALLNSKLLFFILARESNKFRGGYITCTKQYFENLPIKVIEPESQKPFIFLVDKIINAKKDNSKAETVDWEKAIDEMVYNLYDLTEEEIKIIENN